ncbi:hypothetical protein [Calidifontibacter terrae]
MPTLPASVRLSLWATAVWNGNAPAQALIQRAFPDIDEVTGDLQRLSDWPTLGERVLLCALPHPGNLVGLPKCSPALHTAAVEAGECVYVPMLGGALVPELSTYGPQDDAGWLAVLTAYDCLPTPIHRIEMLDESAIERELTREIASATRELADIDAVPWQTAAERAHAAAELDRRWGLPAEVPGRLARIIWTAGAVSAAADTALEQDPAAGAGAHRARGDLLYGLRSTADKALADATNLAALALAGMLPPRG